jgi:hypothetical protein
MRMALSGTNWHAIQAFDWNSKVEYSPRKQLRAVIASAGGENRRDDH